MTGLRSLNRYHAYPWQEGAPYLGELEYLGWAAYGRRNSGADMPSHTRPRGWFEEAVRRGCTD